MSLNAGLESPHPAIVSLAELQYSRSRLWSPCNCNHCEILALECCRGRLRVRLSESAQILLRHVLGLQTPLLRQGDVTDFFSSVHFCGSCGRFWAFRQVGVLFFVRVCYDLGWECITTFVAKFALCFRFCVIFSLVLPARRGPIVWRTFLNLSKMMYR